MNHFSDLTRRPIAIDRDRFSIVTNSTAKILAIHYRVECILANDLLYYNIVIVIYLYERAISKLKLLLWK